MRILKRLGVTVLVFVLLVVPETGRPSQLQEESKLTSFLNKKKPCYAWAFGVYGQRTTFDSVVCVFDGVHGEGTIDERHGCVVALFNVSTGSYESGLEPGLDNPMISGKCAAGTMKPLMEKLYSKSLIVTYAGGANLTRVVFGGPGANAHRAAVCSAVPSYGSKAGCK